MGPLAPVEVVIVTLSADAQRENNASPRKPKELTDVRSSKEASLEVACLNAGWKFSHMPKREMSTALAYVGVVIGGNAFTIVHDFDQGETTILQPNLYR